MGSIFCNLYGTLLYNGQHTPHVAYLYDILYTYVDFALIPCIILVVKNRDSAGRSFSIRFLGSDDLYTDFPSSERDFWRNRKMQKVRSFLRS